MTTTPRERLIQDIGDCFKGECAKVARGEKSTQADGERGVFSDASLADYLLSHGWIESGQAVLGSRTDSVIPMATNAGELATPKSPAPSLEAREPLSAKAGDEVHAWVGTKDGWGKVLSRVDGGLYVEFPDAKYPDTLAVPTGQYFVPWKAVIAVKGASALRGEG